MIRIMIVDDMPIFLEYLRGFVNWEEYGFQICAEAINGKEAYDKIEECYPDVILTDITMPYMDGLELAEKVMQDYPDIAVILITGNNEFEYARKALRIGVCDYIVKPFEKEELILSLLKLQDNIGKVLENADTQSDNAQKEKERALRKCILGKDDGVHPEIRLRNAGISFETRFYLIGCVHLPIHQNKDFEDFLKWEGILTNMLKDTLHVQGTYELFKDFQNNIVFVLNFESEQAQKEYKAYELADFPKIIERRLGMECKICIGSYCYGLAEARKEYYKVTDAVKTASAGKVLKLFDGKQSGSQSEGLLYTPLYMTELYEALAGKEKDTFKAFWEKEWKYVQERGNEGEITQLLSTFLGLLFTDIIQSGSSIEGVYGEEFKPYSELFLISDLQQRIKKLYLYYELWMESAGEKKSSQSKNVAEKARAYIQAHYMNGTLSISDISAELHINQTYLRRMFKEEMGMTLLEFITKYRMHMAKQLILSTDCSLAEIAERVGYNDESYFSKCFKKYYQVSPKKMTKENHQIL